MTHSPFIQNIQNHQILISDGATGTNFQKRGLKPGLPAEIWVIEQPEQVILLHKDFITAGSDIILTCTFGATSIRLEHTGLGEKVSQINNTAVELAKKATTGTDVLVAGSIGPTGVLLKPMGTLDPAEAETSYKQQATFLDRAGVDLFVVETQFDLIEAHLAVSAVRSVSEKPVVCSFSFDRGIRTMMGVKISQLAQELPTWGVDVIGINCGKSLEDNYRNLVELRSLTNLPIWFKPNAGLPALDESGTPIYNISPAEMGAWVPQWVEAGANVIGGCCGTSPSHLKEISKGIKKDNLNER